jgi:hypothetical protein
MTFDELMSRHHWHSIEIELTRLYPDEEQQIEAYQDVCNHLKCLTPKETGIVIRLNEIQDEGSAYVEVDGYYSDGRVDERSGNDALALDFTPWEQWLGMKVGDRAFQDFTEIEIIVHCLYEMTFISFDQEEIREELEGLRKTIAQYESMTPEERRNSTKSLKDLLDELREEGEA